MDVRDLVYGVKAIVAVPILLGIAAAVLVEVCFGVFRRWGLLGGLAALAGGALCAYIWFAVIFRLDLINSSTTVLVLFNFLMIYLSGCAYVGCGTLVAKRTGRKSPDDR